MYVSALFPLLLFLTSFYDGGQDGGQAGVQIHGNIIGGSLHGAVFDNAGGNNTQTNNIFLGETVSSTLMDFGADPRKNPTKRPRSEYGNSVRRNIFVARSNYTSLFGSIDAFVPSMLKPNSSGSDYNVFWNTNKAKPHFCRGTNLSSWRREFGFDKHSVIADPHFSTQGNFQLRPDSPALSLGFKPLPLEMMVAPTPICHGDGCLATILRLARSSADYS